MEKKGKKEIALENETSPKFLSYPQLFWRYLGYTKRFEEGKVHSYMDKMWSYVGHVRVLKTYVEWKLRGSIPLEKNHERSLYFLFLGGH